MSPTEPRSFKDRLDPFTFPSDTNFRFVLLIVSILSTTFFIYSEALLSWVVPAGFLRVHFEDCGQARWHDFGSCLQRNLAAGVPWIAGAMALLLGVAGSIYWCYPQAKIRRNRLEPLTQADAPDLVAYFAELRQVAGLLRPVNLLWNPLNSSSTGLAFGRWRRYYVALSGGLVTQFYTDRPAFRAVVLHELAHLRNADVDITFLTLSVWKAFVVVGLIPFAITTVHESLPDALAMAWRILALTAFVYITRSAILRDRELYADARAAMWDGGLNALKRVLATMPEPGNRGWRATLQLHPLPADRERALDDSDWLFRLKSLDTFALGIAAAIALPMVWMSLANIVLALSGRNAQISDGSTESYVASLFVLGIASWAVGVQIWRATFAAAARGANLHGSGWTGLALSAGLFLGEFISPLGFGVPNSPTQVVWNALLLATVGFFVPWIAAVSSLWFKIASTLRFPRVTYRLCLSAVGLVVGVWSVPVFLSSGHAESPVSVFLVLTYGESALTAVYVGLWAVPFLLWFWPRRKSAFTPESAFLEDVQSATISRNEDRTLFKLPLKIGTAAVLTFGAVMLVVRVCLLAGVPFVTRQSEEFGFRFNIGQVVVAAIIQAAAAVVVQRRVKVLAPACGLFCAFFAGCLMPVAAVGLWILIPGVARHSGLSGQEIYDYALARFLTFTQAGFLLSLISMIAPSIKRRVARIFSVALQPGSPAALMRAVFTRAKGTWQGEDRWLAQLFALLFLAAMVSEVGLAHRNSQRDQAFGHTERAMALVQNGGFEQAVAEFRQAVAARPDGASEHYNLGVAQAQIGKRKEAMLEFRRAIDLRPGYSSAHHNLAKLLAEEGHVTEAVTEDRRAIASDPKNSSARIGLCNSLARIAQYLEAVRECREALAIRPDSLDARYNLGIAFLNGGQYADAIAEYRKVIAVRPDHADAHTDLAIALDRSGDLAGALREYREAIRLSPDSVRFHSNLADAWLRTGERRLAVDEYTKALALNPESAALNNQLGYTLAELSRFDEALPYLERSLQIKPGDPDALDSLGFALAGKGNYDQAILNYREALRTKPQDALIHDHLAQALAKSGHKQEADQEFRLARQIDPARRR